MTTLPSQRRRAFTGLAAAVAFLGTASPAYADNIRDAQWQAGYLHLADAQRLANGGEGVTVAVIDTGVDATHPDLTGNVLPGADFTTPGGGDGRTDTAGHGTAMAGLIAAHGHGHGHSDGALGVAPNAKILPVRVLATDSVLGAPEAQGITWAVQHGANVLSISLGSAGDDPTVRQAIAQAVAADVVVVAGAGNRPKATTVNYPAAYPGVIAVGGIDQNGQHADVSVTGPEITLVAPAIKVVTTQPDDRYSQDDGTSDATALVAGVAALVRAKYPTLPAAEVVHRLTATATDAGAPGRDDQYGYGVVNPVAALTATVTPTPTASATPSRAPSAAVTPAATPSRTDPQPSAPGPVLPIVQRVGYVLLGLTGFVAFVEIILALAGALVRRRR